MNHLKAILFVMITTLSVQAWGVDCSPDEITLSSQADIDDFQDDHGPCDRVVGLLDIDGENIENVNGLSDLIQVGNLRFLFTSELSDLSGLANLTTVDGFLFFTDCDALTNLNGLSSLSSVGDVVQFSFMDSLLNLNGLSSLNSAGSILLEFNTALTNIDGLASIAGVDGSIFLESNIALLNLDGFSGLATTGGSFELLGQTLLTNIDGLLNLTSVGGRVRFSHNPILANCSGAAALLGWPDGPPEDSVVGEIVIVNNASGCNSVEEILASVSGPTAPTITAAEAYNGQAILSFSLASTTDVIWPITEHLAQCLADEQSVFQNNTAMDIPDESSVVSYLTVFGVPSDNAAGLNIAVDITHPRTRHLTLTLESPGGTSVMLWDEAEGDGTDLIGTFPTTLEPAESLDAFDGEYFNGEWQLTVADGIATYTGTLNSWGITVQDEVTATSETSPINLTGVAHDQTYSCTVSAITGLGIGPASDPVPVFWDTTSTCNVKFVSGVSDNSSVDYEACDKLVMGPEYTAEDGTYLFLSSGRDIGLLPGFYIQQGATLSAAVCGQSLCETSPLPMPYGCHSCIDQICDIDATCCTVDFDPACLDMVGTECGLVCE